jgi:Domain of unknown function (DUF4397)
MSNLRKIVRRGMLCALALTAVLLSSCDVDDDNNVQPIPVSYVSIYNAIPDSPELDVTVDSRLVNPRAFRFGDNTYYQNFYTGERKFEISPYGANNVIADTTISLVEGNAYSIFMANEYSNAQILVTNDSAAFSEEGKAKVRLINLPPDAAPVSLKLKDETTILVQDQAFSSASSFIELDPNNYNFEIISSDGEEPILIPDIDLQSGAVRTIVVRGFRNPPAGNTNVISAEVVVN